MHANVYVLTFGSIYSQCKQSHSLLVTYSIRLTCLVRAQSHLSSDKQLHWLCGTIADMFCHYSDRIKILNKTCMLVTNSCTLVSWPSLSMKAHLLLSGQSTGAAIQRVETYCRPSSRCSAGTAEIERSKRTHGNNNVAHPGPSKSKTGELGQYFVCLVFKIRSVSSFKIPFGRSQNLGSDGPRKLTRVMLLGTEEANNDEV